MADFISDESASGAADGSGAPFFAAGVRAAAAGFAIAVFIIAIAMAGVRAGGFLMMSVRGVVVCGGEVGVGGAAVGGVLGELEVGLGGVVGAGVVVAVTGGGARG